jgi:cold shock CspA family protein
MRFDGKLKKWSTERGFGFIAPDQGGQDLFVHISAFPRHGGMPLVGDALSFEIEPDREGRKQAVRVTSKGVALPSYANVYKPAARTHTRARRKAGNGSRLVTLCLVAALGWFGYTRYEKKLVPAPPVLRESVPAAVVHKPNCQLKNCR